MKEKHKVLKSFLTLLLCAAMIVTYMPTSLMAYAVDDSAQAEVAEEAAAEAPAAEAAATEAAPAVEEAAEEPAPAVEAEEPAAEASPEVSEEAAAATEEAAAEEATEEVAEETAEEAVEAEEAEEEEVEEPEEEVFEDGVLKASGDGYKVTVTYTAKAEIPEGASLEVKEITNSWDYNKYLKKTEGELDSNVPFARFFDITILDEEGGEVQPAVAVDVDIQLDDLGKGIATMENVEVSAVHFADGGDVQKVDAAYNNESESVGFDAEGFSVYGVAYTYTVDFYYGSASYSMEGGSSMSLSTLFAKLGIDEKVSNVASITSEGYDGVTTPLDENLTFTKGLLGDYTIKSIQPFDDWYYVTITMNDGTVYVISVTDPPGGSSMATTSTTVDHIDIGITAAASVNVPLAYGTYYDSEGNEVLTVAIGQYLKATGVNESVDITQSDIVGAVEGTSGSITATCNNTSQSTTWSATGYSSSSGESGIEQVRIDGTFYTGTVDDPVQYTVEVDKSVTLTMQYNGTTLYDADGNVVTVTVQTALVASFTYFDEENDCPGLPSNYQQGYVSQSGGMDFVLGTTDDQDANLTAIEIIKYLVDEDGNVIKTSKTYDYSFEVYQSTSGDKTAPANWSGATTAEVDYNDGYSKLSDREITTSTDGLGLVYDYSVADSALIYITEGTPVSEIEDAEGNTLKYQKTYIETEYAWRNDGGETHSNINQSDTLKSIPDVVGDYTCDNYDGTLHNTFLEFYVYNVYAPDTGDLTVTKTVESDLAADADKEFEFTVTLSDTTISGTYGDMTFTNGVATVTLKGGESATAEGLPTGVTYTVEETAASGFTTEKTGDTGTISTTESTAAFTNTRETGDLEVTKTVESAIAADKDKEFTFTVTLGDTSINGTYGDMTFTNGVATFTLKDGETATAEGLPTSVTYTVTETAVDGFTTTKTGDTGTISTTASTAAFKNTRETGDLEVTKTVESDLAADADVEFTFTVTLSDNTISGTFGDMTFANGVATFTLKDGGSATAEGLPTDITYTVVETSADGFTTTKTGDTGTISTTASTAAFTNTRETGDLEVTKTVESDLAADANQSFTFTVTLSDTSISGTYGDMTFTNGVATVTLKNGETATAEGLPTTVTYTVEETAVDGFTTEKTGDTGTISTTASTAAFTNTRETGDLTVKKTVASDASADKDQSFTFTVTLGDTSINGTYGDMTFTDGVATFTLKDGESKTATGLPTSVTYTVAETAVDGFTTTYDSNSGTITTTASTSEFTNTRKQGGLVINKTVVSDLAADADQEFTFTVTLSDTSISGTYGDMTFTNGVATVKLKGGESATAEGLPTDVTYTVVETAVNGFTTTKSGDTGTINTDGSTADFTNTRETGDLEVTKTVVSEAAADATKAFTFTVTLSDTSINGTFGDMTFTNGVATFTLKGGETATAEGLPTTVTYTVEETADDGFDTTKTGDTGTISTTASTAAFTNTRKTGDIEVTKTVKSDLAADADVEFEFTVTLGDTSINGTYGDMTFTDGVATFTLKGGESAKATGLPTDVTYTVTETAVSGFTTTKTGDTGSISTTASTAAFTNTRETGDLEVTKTVKSDLAADKDQKFEFTVTLSDTSISGTYGDMTFTNGVATFTLKGGESATAEGLPTTVTYTVEETAADGFTTTKTGDTGTISTTASTAAFTNTRETGDLEVTKTVKSDLAADKDQKFEFTVTLSDTTISGTYGDMTFTDGVATFTLKGGESAKAEGLPTTVTYTVEETAVDGFTTTKTGDTGTISTTKSTAAFTNTRETGDLTVKKIVTSDLAADKSVEFEFTVTLGDTSISGTYGDMTFTDGVATFTLKGGESAKAEGLPTTVTYTVEETAADGFTTTYDSNSGSISTTASTSTYTNTRVTSGLVINKTVVSDLAADKDKEFTFTVTLGDTSISGTYGDMTFANGVATVTLKGGESASAEGLPTDVTYTVVETAASGFTTTKTGDTGTIVADEAATAAFTNTRETGDLEVTKTVKSDLAADASVEFEFTVTLSDTSISGTYGDMTFTDGVATFTLKGGETATAKGLPTTVTYTVEETAADGFTTTKTGDSGTISTTKSTAAFTNTRETGDLEVTKTVDSDLAADADVEFEFTVTLGDTSISGTYGDMTFTDGVATFTLKGGESAKATGLPTTVTYTVTETAADGFTTTKTGDTGSISTTASTAAFTNTRETGDLEVTKTVESDLAADASVEFEFTVTLSDTSISGTYGDMTFTDGVATVKLKGGESATAEGLPTTVTYTVVETAADGFTTTKTGDTGTISTTASTAAFTNTRETGDLEVTKTVKSDLAADKDQKFTFTVTLGDTSISGTYGDMTFTDGVATFTLKGGETATAEGLPTTVTYTVVETAADGFTTTKTGDTGTISTTASTAAFTNTRETGDLTVKKVVKSDLAADASVEFEFTVTLGDTSISGTYGDMTFADGVATFKLKGGESATATGLPTTVTYTVTETAADGFSTTYDSNSGSISTTASTSTYTNTRVTSGLVINKTVVSDLAADKDKEFTFTVTLGDTSISGTYGDMTFTNGVATVKLKGGESATAEGLPTTLTYTVEETAVDGFTTEKTGDSGTIVADTAATAAFTNTRETGDLTVTKTVETKLESDKSIEFEFTVTLGDTSISGTYGDMTFADGVATFTLTDGESATAEGLPTDLEYTVTEAETTGFTTEKTGDTGTITTEGCTAEFVNTAEETAVTVRKVWDDDDDADGIRPDSLEVTLSNGDTVTLSDDNDWTASISGLPKYENGEEIEYTWTEESIDGYKLTSTKVDGNATTLTNKHDPEEEEDIPDKSVDTGDDTNIVLPIVGFVGALILMIYLAIRSRRRRDDSDEI